MNRLLASLFLSISFVAFLSCKPTESAQPIATTRPGSARLEYIVPDPTYYNMVNFRVHGDIPIEQYVKRARSGFPAIAAPFSGSTISQLIYQSTNGTAIRRDQANTIIADLSNSSYYVKAAAYNGFQAVVYRGGNDFTPKDPSTPTGTNGDYRINATNGLVRVDYGISVELNVNANSYLINNGAYKIIYLPSGLQIIQRGANATHYEIPPAQEMTVTQYKLLLSQITSEASF